MAPGTQAESRKKGGRNRRTDRQFRNANDRAKRREC